MFHAQISWNKKRVNRIQKKSGCNRTKIERQYYLHHKARKRLQTSNKTVSGVSLIYKVRAHATLQKTAAKVVFEGCKVAKIEKTDKSTQNPGFNISFCKVEITFYVNISENAIIFEKKARKSAFFCLNILQIRKIVVSLQCIQEIRMLT